MVECIRLFGNDIPVSLSVFDDYFNMILILSDLSAKCYALFLKQALVPIGKQKLGE